MAYSDPSSGHPDNSDGLTAPERVKLMGDGLVNNLTLLISGAVGIILVPLMLKWLGPKAYGVWIVAMATAGILSTADLGLYSTVVHEVSSSFGNEPDTEAALFVESAGNVYLLLGVIGALLLGVLGYVLDIRLHIGLRLQGTAEIVFWLIGLEFLVDQFNHFAGAVLVGVRRFGYINLIRSGSAIFRAVGIVLLLAMGGSLISIAAWQVFAAVIGVVVTFLVVRRLVPHFHFHIARVHWKLLRQKFSFAISSALTNVFGGLVWQAGSLLIGFMQGSASVVPFYVGEKFPYAAANAGWQVAEALFPAAGQNQNNLARTREILKVGTRWVLVLMFPAAILLWFVGPSLLTVWIGKLDPDTLQVLRLMSVAALADAFMAASLNVLWGRGAMLKVVITLVGVGAGAVGLTLILLPRMGVTGVAWAALLPTVTGACMLFYLACCECHASVVQIMRPLFRGLLLPIAGCSAVSYLASVLTVHGIWSLLGTCLASGTVYVVLLYVGPGENEERQFLQNAFRRVTSYLQLFRLDIP